MTAWKCGFMENGNIALIELDIPEDADRIEFCSHKGVTTGRCSFADVLSIKEILDNGNEKDTQESAVSAFNFNFKYTPRTRVFPDIYNKIGYIQCTNGIHYFKTAHDALAYSRTDYWFNCRHRDYLMYQVTRTWKIKSNTNIKEDIVLCITTNGEKY